MEIPLYIVDAFTNSPFQGNPAAICPLTAWLDDSVMQNIAAENNLSETAFLVPAKNKKNEYELRWFTPATEVDLCGHATVASAFVLDLDKKTAAPEYRFQSKSGELIVSREEDFFYLDFPARPLTQPESEQSLLNEVESCFNIRPTAVTMGGQVLIAEFENEAVIRSLQPDIPRIKTLDCRALNVTAKGDACDFVSRFFAPRVGIDEDPVTGSAHCGLIPYWHRITGKAEMLARQVSARGGELRCRYAGDRVFIGGQAVLYSSGRIFL